MADDHTHDEERRAAGAAAGAGPSSMASTAAASEKPTVILVIGKCNRLIGCRCKAICACRGYPTRFTALGMDMPRHATHL